MKYKNTNEIFNHWRDIRAGKIEMDDEDKAFTEAVKAALAAGLYYNNQVKDYCANLLHPTEWEISPKISGTEGGLFGYAIFHAREEIDFQKALQERKVHASKLTIGQTIKDVRLDSHKFSSLQILEINHETGWVTFIARKRGSPRLWNGSAPASGLRQNKPLENVTITP